MFCFNRKRVLSRKEVASTSRVSRQSKFERMLLERMDLSKLSYFSYLLRTFWSNYRLGDTSQWAKSPKKQSVGVYFWQYGTVSDCLFFFADFAHWDACQKKSYLKKSRDHNFTLVIIIML